MKRDFNKLVAEGAAIIDKHTRMDMTLSEATELLQAAKPGETAFTLWDAYRAGVAAGVRISTNDARRGRR